MFLRNVALLAVTLACIAFSIPALYSHWLGPVTLFTAFMATLATLYLHWLPKLLRRRFMVQENGDLGVVEQRLKARFRSALWGITLGGLFGTGGLLVGLWMSGLL